ncbi:MAG: MATE family efflux transporter [Clostridiales bacterium]|nr:MATE family efflux transporter [Clostridiales bacterium]
MVTYSPERENFLIKKLLLPTLIEQSITAVIGLLATMMVSNVGDYAVSGVSLVDQINFLAISLFNALATGATVIIAQYTGSGKARDAGNTASQSVLICTSLAALLGLFTVIFSRPLLNVLYGSAERQVIEAGRLYLIFSGISYPFFGLYASSAGIMRASGNARTPMLTSVFSNIVNLIVSFILIFGAGLGVLGVSIGILVSRILSGFLGYYTAKRFTDSVPFSGIARRFDRTALFPVLKVSIPISIDGVVFQAARIFMGVLMSTMGTISLHANAIANSLNNLTNIPGNAFQIVAVTIVGQAYGSGKHLSTKKLMFKLCLYATIAHLLNYIPFFPLLNTLIGLYRPTAETVVLLKQLIYTACIVAPFFWPCSFVLPQSLRSVGDARATMLISIVSLLVLRVAGAWFFGIYLGWGIFGVWTGMFLDWAGRAIGFLLRAALNFWNGREKPVDYDPVDIQEAELEGI